MVAVINLGMAMLVIVWTESRTLRRPKAVRLPEQVGQSKVLLSRVLFRPRHL